MLTPEVPVVLPNLRLASNCRYDLDACDIQEKYPDLFQVSLEVEVEPRDKPGREAPPWEGAGMRGLNPKILFSSREEQQDVLSKFGEIWRCGHACGGPPQRSFWWPPVRVSRHLFAEHFVSEHRRLRGGDPGAPLATVQAACVLGWLFLHFFT